MSKRLRSLPPRVPLFKSQRVKQRSTADDRLVGYAWQRRREGVLAASGGLCAPCQAAGRLSYATEVDHIRPLWAGGSNERSNLQPICSTCHRAKSKGEATARLAGDRPA